MGIWFIELTLLLRLLMLIHCFRLLTYCPIQLSLFVGFVWSFNVLSVWTYYLWSPYEYKYLFSHDALYFPSLFLTLFYVFMSYVLRREKNVLIIFDWRILSSLSIVYHHCLFFLLFFFYFLGSFFSFPSNSKMHRIHFIFLFLFFNENFRFKQFNVNENFFQINSIKFLRFDMFAKYSLFWFPFVYLI